MIENTEEQKMWELAIQEATKLEATEINQAFEKWKNLFVHDLSYDERKSFLDSTKNICLQKMSIQKQRDFYKNTKEWKKKLKGTPKEEKMFSSANEVSESDSKFFRNIVFGILFLLFIAIVKTLAERVFNVLSS